MAQAWRTLGASVTLVEAVDRLLANEEPFASAEVAAGLAAVGVEVRTGVKATGASRGDAGQVSLQLEHGERLRGDELLVAVGRRPRTAELGLESVGVEGGGYIDVDDRCGSATRTGSTRSATSTGARCSRTWASTKRGSASMGLGKEVTASADLQGSPRVVFTEPQVAAVGWTLEQATERGIAARAVDVQTSANAGASFIGRNAPGTSRLVVDTARDVVVGATFVGPEIAESLHAASIAVAGEVPISRLVHAVPAFPTRSEAWLYLLESYGA